MKYRSSCISIISILLLHSTPAFPFDIYIADAKSATNTTSLTETSDNKATVATKANVSNKLNTNSKGINLYDVTPEVFGQKRYIGLEAKRLMIGQMAVTPTFTFSTGFNDNLGLESTNETGSMFIIANPNISAYVSKSYDKYTVSYDAKIYRYFSSAIDNRESQVLTFKGDTQQSSKLKTNWSVAYTDGSEARGFRDDTRVANLQSPNEFDQISASAKITYGGDNSKGKLELNAAYNKKRYTSNTDTIINGDFRSQKYSAKLQYRMFPKTYTSIITRYTKTDFTSPTATQDNIDIQNGISLNWRASAKTQLYLQTGHQKRNFTQPNTTDRSQVYHQFGTYWSPQRHNTFELYSGKGIIDGTIQSVQNGISESQGLNWRYAINKYTSTVLKYNRTTTDFTGSQSRSDKSNAYSAIANYAYKPNINFNIRYDNIDRKSSIDGFGYKLNTLFFNIALSL